MSYYFRKSSYNLKSKGNTAQYLTTGTDAQFICQLAHGSPTIQIGYFTSAKQLYKTIAKCFDLDENQVIYCTLNTYKLDMNALFYGSITEKDFIFAHVKGQPKEIELAQIEHPLGLIIADNGAGTSFVKHVISNGFINKRYGSIIQSGDCIETINGISMKGKRHFEVANILKRITIGGMLVLRLVEPEKSGFGNISQRKSRSHCCLNKNDDIRRTIRIKANGDILLKFKDIDTELAKKQLNSLVESFMGISDEELAERILELGEGFKNPSELSRAIENSELAVFEFPFEFICDLWAAIDDIRTNRIHKKS